MELSKNSDTPIKQKREVLDPVKDMDVVLEFRGGAETLFGNIQKRIVCLERKYEWCMGTFIQWIIDNLLKGKVELFSQNKTVRPGILVLINDTDWELLGELEYRIKDNDTIVFVSTLHGG